MEFLDLAGRLRQALKEDSAFFDITSRQIPALNDARVQAKLIAKQKGIVCGCFLILPLFRLLDSRTRVTIRKKDGDSVRPGDVIAVIHARGTALLAGERVFLNLCCHLSGIATLTRNYADALSRTKTVVVDTRKTTPLWRDLEKFAVRCGGGYNHRFSLGDAILVKDNHLQFMRANELSPANIFGQNGHRKSFKKKAAFIAMEAQTYKDVWDGIKMRADIILLDNVALNRIKGSIEFIKAARLALRSEKPLIEVSGRVTMEKARTLADLGVDRISVGALTHSAPALDISLEVD